MSRVYRIARAAALGREHVDVVVATDDTRIAAHCAAIGAACMMTSVSCPTGTNRVLEAMRQLDPDL